MYQRILLLSLLFLINLEKASAQTSSGCYAPIREEGLRLLRQNRYGDALEQFWTARITCKDQPANNDLEKLIRQAQTDWVKDLEASVRREKAAYQKALEAQIAAEKAKDGEVAARKEAERNAQLARTQGKRAESMRLALLADLARQRGRNADALLLAFLALRLSSDESAPALWRSFGEAVRDSFSVPVFRDERPIASVQYIAPIRQVLVQMDDNNLQLTNPATSAVVRIAPASEGSASAVVSHKGQLLVLWGQSARAELRRTDGMLVAALEGHTEPLRCAAFSPNDDLLATGGRDNTIRIWNASGAPVATLNGHTGNIYEVAFLPGGQQLMSRSSDGTARLWNIQGEPLAVLGETTGYIQDAQVSADGRVAVASAKGKAALWQPNGSPAQTISTDDGPLKAVVWAPGGQVATQGIYKTVSVWNANGSRQSQLTHPAKVRGTLLNNAGNALLTWADDHTLRLWALDGRLLRAFTGHRDAIASAVFADDDRYLLTTSRDGTAKMWDMEGNVLMEWRINPDRPLPAAFIGAEGVMFVSPGNQAVTRTPFPTTVYQNLKNALTLQSPVVLDVLRAYQVQLFD